MYLPLYTVLTLFGLLTYHGLEGYLLPVATLPGNTSEANQSTSDRSHVTLQTLLSSVSSKFFQSQLPQKGISCEDLMPDALENFANVSWLPQMYIQAALALALHGAGCSGHAESLVLHLHKELGETDANALLLMIAGSLGTANSSHQGKSHTALEFNLDQLASTRARHCKGLTRINGALLHGQVHRVYRGFQAAATACRRLGQTCAGMSFHSNNSFRVVMRNGSYFLPHHGAHSWLHQCHSLARSQRSIEESCVSEKEQQVHAVVEWVPMVSTFYNLGTSIYYATQDCTEVAKERALEGAMDLGYDALLAGTGGAGTAIGLALKPGVKYGMRALVNYFQQEEEVYPVPINHSGSVIIIK
ncbi:hypothetical protein lerEdw1_001628 [Lerista edwardsae]|nr:hypothetical protein lerEdw1_001628 [Lerista edwardsae]